MKAIRYLPLVICLHGVILHHGVGTGRTIYVDDDGVCDGQIPCYTQINEAIPRCNDGDTVFVYRGIYYENVVIDKSINMIGQERDSTIIDGDGSGDVVHISADSVLVSRFTVRNSGTTGSESHWCDSGVELEYSDDGEITLCAFSDNRAGINLYGSSRNVIVNCVLSSNNRGILFSEIDWLSGLDNFSNRILHNLIHHNRTGVVFEHTGDTHHHSGIIQGNTIAYSESAGLDMIMSQENEVLFNEIANNTSYGIELFMCIGQGELNEFHHNNFISNNGGGVQAYDFSGGYGVDYWYSAAEEEGNYWSDYTGPDGDGDGIGDIPYLIDGEESQDSFPLMDPIEMHGDICPIQVLSPPRIVYQDSSYTPQVTIQNFGPGPAGSVSVMCVIDTNGVQIYSDSIEIATLSSGDDSTISFVDWTVTAAHISGEVTIWTAFLDDPRTMNDTILVSIQTLGCGDCNGDGRVTIADATCIASYIYREGSEPIGEGDVNLDGRVTVADAMYIVGYIYRSGTEPCNPP